MASQSGEDEELADHLAAEEAQAALLAAAQQAAAAQAEARNAVDSPLVRVLVTGPGARWWRAGLCAPTRGGRDVPRAAG